MIEPDTVKLLRECDAGIRMGVDAIADVENDVESATLSQILVGCKSAHEELSGEVQTMLGEYGDEGKRPNFMAESMSRVKTGMKLAINRSDATIADLMTDGCNMGVKSLHRYLNQYVAASEQSKDVAKRLASLEEQLAIDLRPYL